MLLQSLAKARDFSGSELQILSSGLIPDREAVAKLYSSI